MCDGKMLWYVSSTLVSCACTVHVCVERACARVSQQDSQGTAIEQSWRPVVVYVLHMSYACSVYIRGDAATINKKPSLSSEAI
jgi:hypothetical protein